MANSKRDYQDRINTELLCSGIRFSEMIISIETIRSNHLNLLTRWRYTTIIIAMAGLFALAALAELPIKVSATFFEFQAGVSCPPEAILSSPDN